MTTNATFISSDTAKRLLKDVRQLIRHPLTENGIYYSHDEDNFTKGYAMIVGPDETPYFGGYYFFIFDYPVDYPYSPPNVTYITNNGATRFNPNLYINGKVCVSILNTWAGDNWTSCQTINSVLIALCSLLNNAPLENEPGYNRRSIMFNPYQKSIEFMNIDFSICDMVLKHKIPEPFHIFYPFIKEHFINNYDKLYAFIESKVERVSVQSVDLYKMTTHINYDRLKTKLINTKEFINVPEQSLTVP